MKSAQASGLTLLTFLRGFVRPLAEPVIGSSFGGGCTGAGSDLGRQDRDGEPPQAPG
jgi:hypothetical protein